MMNEITWLSGLEYLAVIRSWIGVGEDDAITKIGFRGPVSWVFMVLLPLLAVAFASWTYWREERLQPALRGLLAFCRSVVYVALLCIIFCPFAMLDRTVKIKREAIILLDQSKSMRIEDRYADRAAPATAGSTLPGVSRMDAALGLLEQDKRQVIKRLDESNHVRGFGFGEKLQPAGLGAEALLGAFSHFVPMDESTRGGDALNEILAKYGGREPAAIVMLTDGVFNAGSDILDSARRMKDLGIPLFTVGIGSEVPKDIRVGHLITPEVVFPQDKVSARASIFSNGYHGTPAKVRLLLDQKELSVTTVDLVDGNTFVDLPYVVPEDMAGTGSLAVVVDPQPDEQTHDNNRSERLIRVIGEKIKVLYVEGAPRWEYRYLKVVLQRDRRLDVKFLLTQGDPELAAASSEYLSGYPANPEKASEFDLVILGDVPASYFSQPQMEEIVRTVRERGASLLMLAGEQHAPASYRRTPIGEILPVKIRDGLPDLVSDQRYPTVTEAGRRSFTSLGASDELSDELWSLVSPLYSLPPLDGVKPAANVLLELADSGGGPAHPLVAWHYAGTGKVMFVGTDQLWRLRKMRGDEYHAQFWSKGIQFLSVSRLLGENKPIRLETDRLEFTAGDMVQIHAKVLDDAYQPATATEYQVRVERFAPADTFAGEDKVQTVTLTPVTGTPGLFHGRARLVQEGRYQLTTRPEDRHHSNVVDMVAAKADLEMQETAMQASHLREIAALSGGRHLSVQEWSKLPGLIPADTAEALIRHEVDIWDVWPLYLLIVICAGLEWFIRRRYDLV